MNSDIDLTIPTDITEWNYEKILQFVEICFEENERLEYLKKAWNLSKEEKLDIEKKICSFANTEGGFILYGIKEERENSKLQKLISLKINGVENVPNTENRIASIIKNTKPYIKFEIKKINIPTSDKIIIIVQIKKNMEKPVESSKGIYYIRIQSSSEKMNRNTLQNLFLDSDKKVQKRNNLLFELEDVKRICEKINSYKHEKWVEFPILDKIDITSLKQSLILNYEIFISDDVNTNLRFLLTQCRSINENIEELKSKIAGGAYKLLPGPIINPLDSSQEIEKEEDTFYGSYNKVTMEHAGETIKLINEVLNKV